MLFPEFKPAEAANDNDDLSYSQLGRYGEFMICADLTRRGYYAMHVDAPGFDVLLVHANRSYRVQVKSSSAYRSGKPTWRCRTHAVSTRGNQAVMRKVSEADADIVALFHHDFDGAIYLPIGDVRDRINIPATQLRVSRDVDTVATSLASLEQQRDASIKGMASPVQDGALAPLATDPVGAAPAVPMVP